MNPKKWISSTAVLALAGILLSGCGLAPAATYVPPAGPGSISPLPDLPKNASMTVTSKAFTEQLVLGKIAVLAGQAAGFKVNDLTNVPGSQPARELLHSGQATMMWDYTGTAWMTYLGHEEGIADQPTQWQKVHDQDVGNGIVWGAPAPMNNTYAMAVRSEAVEELGGISKLSQLKDLDPKELTFCVDAEFNSRSDGLNPLLELYGLKRGDPSSVPESNVGLYDTGAIYSATDNGSCNFGEVFTTDGRIKALDLTVLEDDKGYFPAYNVAPVFFGEFAEQYPGIEEIFAQISPLLTDEALQGMNLEVDVNGREPADVAFDWMVSEGFISEP
ncbi:glycine betaine ABC transporter substrate-binding protein [Paeniglutamicibacter gangotriensis]|uniref:Glycine betaine transport system permease/glycine betaine-binding protein n=1 Tax=Paeniglutamicibacter gangotriensis Lz1y TaxID=1276920 RepID=M7NJN2_9MICC|nr:glycine betaine ABC transporter substrate-binding protein [Paeniglutamicibacter gangotriensis]EMQ98743.1 glycine betaine transport system permease/glycine betaine-binding protein [Paeniglutamicibacter gangotriensis Lz1y]